MATTQGAHPFTCNTCQVAFRSSDLQRTHMQSDWHRYNLKRRVASLPPLNSEVFAEKVLANKASAAATAARASFEKRCEACDKTYFSEGAYVNHLGSQKHRMSAAGRRGGRDGLEGTETESMAGSTFTLGETLDTASTTASTVNGENTPAEEEFEEIAASLQRTQLGAGAHDLLPRPTVPTSAIAAQNTARTANRLDEKEEEEEEEEEEDDDDDEEHKADLQQCLFCNYISPSMDLNMNHMSRQHSFFIPEKDYLVDLPGLINHLSETIRILHECLFCHKQIHTGVGAQTHMRDRGHCMIAYDTEDEQMEVGDFYDFRATYSDEDTEEDEEEEKGAGRVSLGAKRAATTTAQNEDGDVVEMDDDEGWESDSTLSSVPTDEITSVPIEHQNHKYEKLGLNRHHSHADPRPHRNSDGFHSHAHHGTNAVYYDEYELHLPSGRTAGHRTMNKYYRQNLRNYPSAEERAQQRMIENERHDSDAEDVEERPTEQSNDPHNRQVVSRTNGGLGMTGVSEATKRQVRAVEKRDQKRQQRAQARYQWGNDRRGNFQKHFRDPLLQ